MIKLLVKLVRNYLVALLFLPLVKTVWDAYDLGGPLGVLSFRTLFSFPENILYYFQHLELKWALIYMPGSLILIYTMGKAFYHHFKSLEEKKEVSN